MSLLLWMKRVPSPILMVALIALSLLMWQLVLKTESDERPRRTPLTESLPDENPGNGLVPSSAEDEQDRPWATIQAARPMEPPTEEEFLRRLDELNASDKSRALAWAREGADWVTGVAAEAREAMIITLLVDLNRMGEARASVREFIAAHPDSPYRPLVQGVTGVHPRPGPPAHVVR